MEVLSIGGKDFAAHKIPFAGCNLLFISGTNGALACGYFNLAAAEKMGHALAIVSGVSNFQDMLQAKVIGCSPAAEKLGVRIGMSGRDALEKLG